MSIVMLMNIFVMVTAVVFISSGQYLFLILLVGYLFIALPDLLRDIKRYGRQGHSGYCGWRRALLNAGYRWPGYLGAPGAKSGYTG